MTSEAQKLRSNTKQIQHNKLYCISLLHYFKHISPILGLTHLVSLEIWNVYENLKHGFAGLTQFGSRTARVCTDLQAEHWGKTFGKVNENVKYDLWDSSLKLTLLKPNQTVEWNNLTNHQWFPFCLSECVSEPSQRSSSVVHPIAL